MHVCDACMIARVSRQGVSVTFGWKNRVCGGPHYSIPDSEFNPHSMCVFAQVLENLPGAASDSNPRRLLKILDGKLPGRQQAMQIRA
jgi:hypothetical protein